jgi:hypothetical protein
MPKEKAAPLKEEYLQFYQEVTRYHDCVEGNLKEFPTLTEQLLDIPELLKTFTDKIQIIISVTELLAHLSNVRAFYDTTHWKCEDCAHSVLTMTGSAASEHSRSLNTALPTSFDGSAAKARMFLAECNNYIALNQSCFPSDSIKIQWALQLCTDRVANWKRIQLELMEEAQEDDGYSTPDHLCIWEEFQKNFRLKWADLNTKQKAWQHFLAGLKQTGSVWRYMELFKEVVLEAEFRDPDIVASTFYNSLKYEVKCDLVGRRPDDFNELKALAITLDEECIAAQDPTKKREIRPKTTTHSPDLTPAPKSEPSTQQQTPVVKSEANCIGARLSEEEWAKRMKEGRCFNCGEQGHRRPECPGNKPKTQITAVETTADSTLNPDEPKN